jgi:hypothetical protein
MDPGTVVWLPGTGYGGDDYNAACEGTYGSGYYACGAEDYNGGTATLVFCCHY